MFLGKKTQFCLISSVSFCGVLFSLILCPEGCLDGDRVALSKEFSAAPVRS